jgi:uncharacterized protein
MIRDPRLFVGRRQALHQLSLNMSGAQPISINVVGERRIGKSSLLYHFYQTWDQRVENPQRYVVIYLSLQNAKCQQEGDFYEAIATELLRRPVVQGQPRLRDAFQPAACPRRRFADAVERWHEEGVLPVLCLDEFEALLESTRHFDDDFYNNLRSLMDASKLMLIVSSHRELDLYRRKKQLTSNFFNLGHTEVLEEMPDNEVADLVRLPASTVTGSSAALSSDEQQKARTWGNGHPYLLQLACSLLCQARQQGHDQQWVERQFQRQARRVPRRQRWLRKLLTPLRWIFWDLPRGIGSLAAWIGIRLDDVKNWLIGMALLLALLLAILGIFSQTQLFDLLKTLIGQ